MSERMPGPVGEPDLPEGPAVPEPTVPAPTRAQSAGSVPAPDPQPRVRTVGTALSPSRAADFLNCPLLFRFRVVDRLPEPPSPAATRGTVVHAVLERLFDLDATERVPERAVEMVVPEWERLLTAEPGLAELFAEDEDGSRLTAWLAGARSLLDTYFRLEDPRRLEPAEREAYVETVLDSGLLLRGYVDRIDVAPDGAVRVVDYKTGRAPGPGFEARALFQMKFYALVLWRERGVLPRRLQLMYLGSGDVLTYDPDEADLRATERKLVAVWAAVERAARSGQWRPNPGRLCDWCAHRALCPSFGGTPPPHPRVELVPAARGARGRGGPGTTGTPPPGDPAGEHGPEVDEAPAAG